MLEILPERISYPISNNYRISIYYDSDSQDGFRIEIGKVYLESVVDKDM